MNCLKLFLATFFLLSFSLVEYASAQGRPRPRPYPFPDYRPGPAPRPMPNHYPQGHIRCSASDRGWEEHGSHNSCGDCLRRHGKCIETCKELRQACEVQGQDYQGRVRIYRAIGVDRWNAESEARRQCDWDRNNRFCVTTGCSANNRIVSSRNCR